MEKTIVNEALIFEMDPSEVGVSNTRPRQRKDMGEIEKMLNSIKQYGQIHPIVIDSNKNLIAGGRRLAACILGGIKVRACYKDSVDDVLLQELELEENIQRKSLLPAEEALATSKLFELKQQRLGKSVSGREGGFTLNDVAALLGKSRGSIMEDLQIADAVKAFPNLSELKTKSEIKKAVKGLERAQQSIKALSSYEETIKNTDKFILVNKSAENYLAGIGEGTVDLFFTDPPYGIDIHDLAMTIGGATGGEINATGTSYEDGEDYAKKLLGVLCKESYRITKDNGHSLIFCAPSHFTWLSDCMRNAGWLVAPRPIVWIKRETGQNNQPERWFSSAYEFLLFARKPNSTILIQGKPDWIQCDPVLPSERIHQAEKPVELCKELISRLCLPGCYMVDPCMGSGALVEAGVRMRLLCMGCEKDGTNYSLAVSRMFKLHDLLKY